MAGRRPTPTAIKRLNGNAGHRSFNEQEIAAEVGAPEKPKGLGRVASREWDFMVPQLIELGVITRIDGKSLAEYCKSAEVAEQAYRDMRTRGLMLDEPVLDKLNQPIMFGTKLLVQHKANPAVGVWKTATSIMKSYLIEFGLTPASRAKLKIAPRPAADPFDSFLNGKPVPVSDGTVPAGQPASAYFKTGVPDIGRTDA